jgi:predicted HicB family RNase H-like nuclease
MYHFWKWKGRMHSDTKKRHSKKLSAPQNMKKITAKDYLKVIEWSNEDKCFIGSAPPLIGPCCHGKTEAEVLPQLSTIVAEWIKIYNEDGLPLPRSATGEYSGKFLLRTGKELHRFLAIRALQSGESLNNFIVKQLRASSGGNVLDTPKKGKREPRKSLAHA